MANDKGSLLEFVQTRMQPVDGKAKLSDLLEVQRRIPDERIPVMAAVPQCMFDSGENIIAQNVTLLAWIQMRRDKPDITQEEVAGITSFHDQETFVEFMERIYWFWSDLSRDRFDQIFADLKEKIKITPLDGETEEVADENPTASESS